MKMKNDDIRRIARVNDVRLWEVAEELGMADSNFSRLLRKDLSEEKRFEILNAIDKIAEKKGAEYFVR
jgi:hypothetical protein